MTNKPVDSEPLSFSKLRRGPGTIAHEYMDGKRSPNGLEDDKDLVEVRTFTDNNHPEGGLLYIFRDDSYLIWEKGTHSVN